MEKPMLRGLLSLLILLMLSCPAGAVGIDRFPSRPFDDIRRPRTAQEVRVSYRTLVNRRNGIDSLEAKLVALYEMVESRQEIGYDLSKPKILAETANEWRVGIPSNFSINDHRKPADFTVCVDKAKGRITCFGPQNDTH
jgi:hypothetical protein